jgi:hypothetical protein
MAEISSRECLKTQYISIKMNKKSVRKLYYMTEIWIGNFKNFAVNLGAEVEIW